MRVPKQMRSQSLIYSVLTNRTGAIAASALGLVTISLFSYVLVLHWFTGQKINVRTLYRDSIADIEIVGVV